MSSYPRIISHSSKIPKTRHADRKRQRRSRVRPAATSAQFTGDAGCMFEVRIRVVALLLESIETLRPAGASELLSFPSMADVVVEGA